MSASSPSPSARRPRPPRSEALWGDGFVGDGVAALGRVVDWDHVSSDEYALFFPELARDASLLPAPLLAHVRDCAAVRRWRLSACAAPDGGAAARLADLHRDWFAGEGIANGFMRRLGITRMPSRSVEREREHASLSMLEALLAELSRGRRPDWTPDREAGWAFASGIHPAYLWVEASVSVDRGCTAAWLGHLDRGRSALMPTNVAEYLLDAVVARSGARDALLAEFVDQMMPQAALRRAAERCLVGRSPVVRASRGPSRPAPSGARRATSTPSEEMSFERA